MAKCDDALTRGTIAWRKLLAHSFHTGCVLWVGHNVGEGRRGLCRCETLCLNMRWHVRVVLSPNIRLLIILVRLVFGLYTLVKCFKYVFILFQVSKESDMNV